MTPQDAGRLARPPSVRNANADCHLPRASRMGGEESSSPVPLYGGGGGEADGGGARQQPHSVALQKKTV